MPTPEHRKINITYLDHELDLGNTTHELDNIKNWTKKIRSGTLRDILKKSPRFDQITEGNKYYNEIPNYMRNAYAHCKDHDKVCNFNLFN